MDTIKHLNAEASRPDCRIAVLMPAYNPTRQEVGQSLMSIADQAVPLELFLIDDGSAQPVVDLLPDIDYPVHVVTLARNGGIVGALNTGLEHILKDQRFDLIARLDVADTMRPNRLRIQSEYLDARPNMILCGTDTVYVDDDSDWQFDHRPGDDPASLARQLTRANPLAHSSVMFKRQLIEELGPYSDTYPLAEDYELWSRAARHYEIGNVPELLTVYAMQNKGVSRSRLNRQLRSRLAVQWAYLPRLSPQSLPALMWTLFQISVPSSAQHWIKPKVRGQLSGRRLLPR